MIKNINSINEKKTVQSKENQLTEHFFRNEYGKMVAVVAKYLGAEHVESAEDIVQDSLLVAVEYWQHHGIPENPSGWLYTTAKNKTFNYLKHQKHKRKFEKESDTDEAVHFNFSDEQIADEQLRMMFACCNPSISEEVQITLILKILCGFSISEISAAFFTNTDTINKRLVRGRKKLRSVDLSIVSEERISKNCDVVLEAIYLLFNEGYLPNRKNQSIRTDLCLEAIRLTHILASHPIITQKVHCHAFLALMYLNASRFEARVNENEGALEMEKVDRSLWNKTLIDKGLYHLEEAQQQGIVSNYLLMASISANHCIAPSFEETNWKEILALYDAWLTMEDTAIIRLNRSVALSKVHGDDSAIAELKLLETRIDLRDNYLLHSTLGELHRNANHNEKAISHFERAIKLADNERDKTFLKKKLKGVVPL
ncbi:MAG: sigma-70 family RNA polymerase sigma factor [Reichenbachiella sp.]|uniref:RNA polymerase sigma factor n=1 Tax=Reichenbachiella sp. TaxID=2184521 RepID=UPI0032675700